MGADAEQPDRTTLLEQRVALLERQIAALQATIEQPRPVPGPLPSIPVPPLSAAHQPAAPPIFKSSLVSRPAHATRGSLEDRLGSQIFNRIGIVLLLIGTSWFLKLAVDRGWIVPNPIGRLLAGLLAGAALVLWSERFRRHGFAAFSYSLKALGSGVLYLSLWAGFHLYHLLPAPVDLGLMIAVTGWNAYMAWVQNAELLAAYALAGGFATPILLSSGRDQEIFLFTYLLALDVAIVVLARLKVWPRLLLGAFPLTVAFFIAWYVQFWAPGRPLAVTALFVLLFGGVFASVALGKPAPQAGAGAGHGIIEDLLLPLANAAFLALAFYSILEDSGHRAWLPWTVVALAVVYLGLMRLPQRALPAAVHLSLAVMLLTVAIPLKANGHWITVGWLVEGVTLAWIASRLHPQLRAGSAERARSRVLRWLSLGTLGFGFFGVAVHLLLPAADATRSLWTAGTVTALLGVSAFSGSTWLAVRGARELWSALLASSLAAITATAVLLSLDEIAFSWAPRTLHPPLASAAFGRAVLGLLVLAGIITLSLGNSRGDPAPRLWRVCATGSILLFNALAVLTGVREVAAVWRTTGASSDLDAGLKQALAISGFLMLYGAALLATGFWRRSAFLRWQGLILLLFTICKTFLYDMRNLSQGYRVVSVLALGALLMAVSFAYQRDWLALRATPLAPNTKDDAGAAR